MKELKEFTFHSRHLIPYSVGLKGIEHIQEWIENKQARHRFQEGDEVCHKENTNKKLYVKDILREIKPVRSGFDKDAKPIVVNKTRMIGILCYYWEDARSESTVQQ